MSSGQRQARARRSAVALVSAPDPLEILICKFTSRRRRDGQGRTATPLIRGHLSTSPPLANLMAIGVISENHRDHHQWPHI